MDDIVELLTKFIEWGDSSKVRETYAPVLESEPVQQAAWFLATKETGVDFASRVSSLVMLGMYLALTSEIKTDNLVDENLNGGSNES